MLKKLTEQIEKFGVTKFGFEKQHQRSPNVFTASCQTISPKSENIYLLKEFFRGE
jgi:hypothetical protein